MANARLQDTMAALEAAGTEQNRKIYRRHGASDPLFGVSFANIGALAKRLGTDQDLADALWKTGNADARYLALRIADPRSMGSRQLEAWAKDFDQYVIVELFARYLGVRSPHARALVQRWTKAKGEWKASAGWAVLACLALTDDGRPDDAYRSWLLRIEAEIHRAPNRVRHEMNGALIAIGTRSDALARAATAAAKRIGKVLVDHGETGCKTPDAIPYVAKARAHRKAKGTKRDKGK